MAVGKKNACPVCKGRFAEAYLATHMRKAHDLDGGLRAWRKAHPPTSNGQAVEVYRQPVVEPEPLAGLHFPANIKVGLGEDGSMWICEQVRAPRGRP